MLEEEQEEFRQAAMRQKAMWRCIDLLNKGHDEEKAYNLTLKEFPTWDREHLSASVDMMLTTLDVFKRVGYDRKKMREYIRQVSGILNIDEKKLGRFEIYNWIKEEEEE